MGDRVAVPCTINHLRDNGDIFVQIPAATGENTIAWVHKDNLIIERQRPTGQTMRGFVLGCLLGKIDDLCSVTVEERGVPVTLLVPEQCLVSEAEVLKLLES